MAATTCIYLVYTDTFLPSPSITPSSDLPVFGPLPFHHGARIPRSPTTNPWNDTSGLNYGQIAPLGSLSAEIRLMILEEVAQQKHAGWASLASVCKEWQFVLAKANFCRLKLRPSCLDDFERLIVRQRHLVRHIQLEIDLPRYSCRDCNRYASNREMDQENLTISRGIWRLLRILGSSEPGSRTAFQAVLRWSSTLILPAMENTGSRTFILPLMMSMATMRTRTTARGMIRSTAGSTANRQSRLLRRRSGSFSQTSI